MPMTDCPSPFLGIPTILPPDKEHPCKAGAHIIITTQSPCSPLENCACECTFPKTSVTLASIGRYMYELVYPLGST